MKTALITGGSRSIGAAMVRLFAQKGWRVAFSYNKSENEALALSKETGAIPLHADFARRDSTAAFARAALKQLCHVDALIVNAGISRTGLMCDMPNEEWDEILAVNLTAPFLLLKEIIPAMRSRGGGAAVLVSSVWGKCGAACEAAYSASKAGLIALCEALAREEGPGGIRLNALCPGVIQTDMLSHYTKEDLEALRAQTPLDRLGIPEDVARAAYFLCSDDAAFITGQALSVDGGFLPAR